MLISAKLAQRTARSSLYSFIQVNCTHEMERKMLAHATSLQGIPFSNYGMFCSVLWPRITDGKSFFCAELVATILKTGGLLPANSNAGAFTPDSLHEEFSKDAALTGNPYQIRRLQKSNLERKKHGADSRSIMPPVRRKGDSPPRSSFKLLTPRYTQINS